MTTETLEQSLVTWRAGRHLLYTRRIEAGKCCEHVHPNNTSKWHYCKKPAVGKCDDGITYCAQHLPKYL